MKIALYLNYEKVDNIKKELEQKGFKVYINNEKTLWVYNLNVVYSNDNGIVIENKDNFESYVILSKDIIYFEIQEGK